eukprot:s636_g25.t1
MHSELTLALGSDLAFWIGSLTLETLAVLRLLLAVRSVFQRTWQRELEQRLQEWWKFLFDYRIDQQTAAELDALRCRVTRRVWCIAAGLSMLKLIVQQIRLLTTEERNAPGSDLSAGFMVAIGILLCFKPQILNPRSLDAWYVATSLMTNLTLALAPVDTQRFFLFHLTIIPLLAVLTRRSWCFLFCMGVSTAQILLAEQIHAPPGSYGHIFAVAFALPVSGVLAIRWLLHDYIVLKMDLQSKLVAEMLAASSLLLVCYDAVVQVDETLKLTEDSQQLTSLLRSSGSSETLGSGPVAGRSLLDFFCREDQDRICKQLASSILDGGSVVALNVDIEDQDHPKQIEVVFAQFRNLSKASRFLVGIRELSELKSCTATRSPSVEAPEPQDFVVVFEVPSLEILAMSEEMELLCESTLQSKAENVLDISGVESRESFEGQLQLSINSLANVKHRSHRSSISFNLLGHCNVLSSLVLEYDDFLHCFVASLHIHSPPGRLGDVARDMGGELTAANIQRLQQTTAISWVEIGGISSCARSFGSPWKTLSQSSQATPATPNVRLSGLIKL